MYLEFHPLTLSDRDLVWKYTENAGRRNCDLSFSNLFAWQTLYRTEVAEESGFLVFRFQFDGHLAYLMPMGEGDLGMVLQAMKEDACRMSRPLLIMGVCVELLPVVRDCIGEDWRMNENRDHADYVYLRESLATLSGKKLQSKRNHVNRFKALYPDYHYAELTEEWVPACLELTSRWMASRTDSAERNSVTEESKAIHRVLSHREELGLRGGVLLVRGKVVAFTYGAPICRDTFDVCVEKAEAEVEGAYTMINKEFVSNLPEQFVYVNREEDLGVEGLREAKLSYHPAILLKKYSVWSLCTVKSEMDRCGQTKEEQEVKWETLALWNLCFDDTEAFVTLYFRQKYVPQQNSYLLRDGRVVSALQRLPYEMVWSGETVPVAYVSGVCTHPKYRGKGLMTELIAQAHRRMYADGMLFSVLIPADEGLFDVYGRFDYHTCPFVEPRHVDNMDETGEADCEACTSMSEVALEEWQAYLDEHLRRMPLAFLHDVKDLHAVCADLFLDGGCVVTARCGGQCVGLWMAVKRDGRMKVLESFADSVKIESLLRKKASDVLGLSEDVPCIRQENRVQWRVVHVLNALKAYARRHADESGQLCVVEDWEVAENNGVYEWTGGDCRKIASSCYGQEAENVPAVSICELPHWLFRDFGPYLSLMMN
ncbi:MAG: GNAT family N-acetyltransferase [Paraprevotella sp.]|nr:GNAT family N-acetyltransferase [Paraprevotella sp.]